MTDEIHFTCEECGKDFDPDPEAMLETTWIGEPVSDEESEKIPEEMHVTASQLRELSPEKLYQATGLTPEQLEALLRGEEVTAGGMCVCRECQDRLAEEQAHE